MIYTYENMTYNYKIILPRDIDIYAFMYEVRKEHGREIEYLYKPTLGQIKDDEFYAYKHNTDELSEYGTSIWSRHFADTYEEAVKGYNQLIDKRITTLIQEIRRLHNLRN